jgi:hypothetical protein
MYFNDHNPPHFHVKYNDGKEGIINSRDLVLHDKRDIFKQLKNLKLFKDFKVDMDAIVWSNGADLAPEYLYENIDETKTELIKNGSIQ